MRFFIIATTLSVQPCGRPRGAPPACAAAAPWSGSAAESAAQVGRCGAGKGMVEFVEVGVAVGFIPPSKHRFPQHLLKRRNKQKCCERKCETSGQNARFALSTRAASA